MWEKYGYFLELQIQLECRSLPILDHSVLTIYDDDDFNVIFFGVQWPCKRLTPQTSDLEVGVQVFLLGCYLIQDTFLHYVCLQPGVV